MQGYFTCTCTHTLTDPTMLHLVAIANYDNYSLAYITFIIARTILLYVVTHVI